MILARMYMRLKVKRQSADYSDIFLILAWCMSVTTASFDIVFYVKGALQEHISFSLVGFTGTVEEKEYVLKVYYHILHDAK
jgi:hypothetical protein